MQCTYILIGLSNKYHNTLFYALSAIFNLFRAAFCSELQFLVCLTTFNFESTKVARCLDGLRQKNRNERREKENENDKTVHQ